MTPPPAMVPLIRDRVSSTSSPLMTSCRCRGVILFTFRSLLAFSANSRTSAVSTFISCLPIDCYLTKFNKRGEMKPAPKPAEATSNVSQDHLKPSKQSRDPRHKMDYAIFVIEEVYDARKAEQLGELLKQTLNELFDHYSLLSGVSQVQKEKQTEEMEDIETGFEDLRLNETMMAIED
ncbi:hypothetical protein V6N12_058919 [Hibiscus sabdariffa]|uniref:Uncharacterized protein n=1 Tax=Hibiscus sabdariffa TaxID=183260 RepID=A0ABR2EVH0_9ROSI